MGNQFLSNIRETDAIIHVVRAFENDDIVHVSGKVSPIDDIEIINTELILSDLSIVEKLYQKAQKNTKSGQKEGMPMKELVEKILEYAIKDNSRVVPICAEIEAEICELSNDEKKEFLLEMGQSESGIDRLIKAGYDLLGLHTYFTAGEKEVKAWTITVGDSAPAAAGKIHTDFEKGFIRAETISFQDYITYKGEKGAKDAGKLRTEGKDYVVKDGDIMHFLHIT